MASQPYLRLNLVAKSPGSPIGAMDLAESIRSQLKVTSVGGCKMPPVRVLAHQLAISKNTVQAAYNELVDQNLLESRPRVGLFVATEQTRQAGAPVARVPVPKLVEPFPKPVRHRAKRVGEPTIQLSGVWIDPDYLPREKITACFRSVLKQPGLMTMYDGQGYKPLREILSQRLQRRGIQADPKHIVMTAGSQQGYDLVCRMVEQKRVAIESPAYGIARQMFAMNGMRPVGLPIDPFQGVDLEVWRKRIEKHRPSLVSMTTNFQNPTGYSYSTEEISEILGMSETYGFGMIEDDWGSDMMSFSEFKPSVRSLGGDGVFYLNSFTKKVLPSLRLGYIVGGEETTPLLLESKTVSCLAIPTVIEAAMFEFLDRGYYDANMKVVQAEMDRRYRLCLEALRETMPEGVRWTTPGGGPVLWVDFPKRVDVEALRERLAARNVIVLPVESSFLEKSPLNGIRVGYGLPKPETMRQAIEILNEEVRKML